MLRYRSIPALYVSTLPSTLEIKSYTRFSSDSLELYTLLFLSPSFWKIGCEGFNTRGWDPKHVFKGEHALFGSFEAVTPKLVKDFRVHQQGRFKVQ